MLENFAGLIGQTVFLVEVATSRRISAHSLLSRFQELGQRVADDDAVARLPYGRLQQPPPREFAVFLVRHVKAGYGTGHAGGEMAESRTLWIYVAVFIEIHIASRAQRRHLAVIDCYRFTACRVMDEHEAAAAQVACPWSRDGQRESDRDGGVHRVTPVSQHICTYLCRHGILRRDHAGPTEQRMRAIVESDDRAVSRLR